MDEITVTVRHSAFDTVNCDRSLVPYQQDNRLTLLDIRDMSVPRDVEVVVSVNGQVVPEGMLAFCIPKAGDHVVITPRIEYAAAIAGWVAAIVAIGSSVTVSTLAIIAYCVVYALVYVACVGLMIGAGMLINSLFAPDMPNSSLGDFDTSQLYSWSPQTTNKQGGVVPRMYGETRAVGNAIAVYTENVSDKSYMNILISLGMGPVYEISDFKINDQDSRYFTGVSFEARYGYLNQAVITNFNDTKSDFPLSRLVSHGTPVEYVTINDTFDQLEVDVSFPKGLYYANDQGSLSYHSVTFKVEAVSMDDPTRKVVLAQTVEQKATEVGLGHWSLGNWQQVNTGQSYSLVNIQYGYEYSPAFTWNGVEYVMPGWAWSELTTDSSVYGDHVPGTRGWTTITVHSGLYFNGVEYTYPLTVEGIWRWIKTAEDYYNVVYDYVVVSEAKNSAIIRTYKSSVPVKGRYKITVTKLSADIFSNRYGDELTLSAVREIYNDDFSYPRHTLVGLRALASDQLSGTLGFSCLIKGALIQVYNGSVWTVEYSTNPAWVCYDVLSQPVFNDPSCVVHENNYYQCKLSHTSSFGNLPPNTTYWQAISGPVDGATTWAPYTDYVDITDAGVARYDGINPTKLDYTAFKTWADFCDVLVDDGDGGTEKRFEFNGGFDAEFSLWDAAFRVCQMSRAALYWNGNTISVIIDQAATPAQLFSSGNIIVDSFEETFLPYEDRAAEIEISFTNKEMEYARDTFTIFNTTLDNPTSKASLQLVGCTKPSQAWRSGQFLLLCNQYITRAISFKADIDAIACTIGDVINFQHDVPRWGLAGGRVVSATETTVTLDTEVTIEAGKTYAVMIRLSTDVLVTKTVSNVPGTYTELTVSTPFTSVPVQYDVYSFGESDTVTKPFRVQSVERSEGQQMTINCLEYDANVYSVDSGTPLIPVIEYSSFTPISPVTDIVLKEEVYFDVAGNLMRDIVVTFNKPDNPLYKQALIFYAHTSNRSMIYAGTTVDTTFRIPGVIPLESYHIAIQSESYSGVLLKSSEWPAETITVTNELPITYDEVSVRVSGLEIFGQGNDNEFTGPDCRFSWNSTYVGGSVSEAGDEPAGAGSSAPESLFKDYEVKIYTSAGVLRRVEYVLNPEYTYTLDKNTLDGDGTPIPTFIIGVRGRTWYGTYTKDEARLSVINPTPAIISSIVATSMVGGVQFEWVKSIETDLDYYYVSTAVGSGSYSTPEMVTDNKIVRVMTTEEVNTYGSNAYIYCRVYSVDVFGQISTPIESFAKANILSDNIFQLVASKSGGTGTASSLYDGNYTSGGVVI